MTDLLIRLYDLPEDRDRTRMAEQGINIRRAIAPERHVVVDYAHEFSPGWGSECAVAFSGHPVSVLIATQNEKIIGFACYDATAKGLFGPTGVSEDLRGKGVGGALLMATLRAMYEAGYAYGVIGGVTDALAFYKKKLDALEIPHSEPGFYKGMLS